MEGKQQHFRCQVINNEIKVEKMDFEYCKYKTDVMAMQRQSPDMTSCMSPTEFADDCRFSENDVMIGRSISPEDNSKIPHSHTQKQYSMQADTAFDSRSMSDDDLEYKDPDENDDCVFLENDKTNTHYICLDRLPRPFISTRPVCLSATSDVSTAYEHPLDLRHSKMCRRMSDVSDSDIGFPRKGGHRRIYTNSRERWRQQNVNGAFNDLRSLIPTYPADKKLSKSEILRFAIKYIKLLTNVVEYQENEESTGCRDRSKNGRQKRGHAPNRLCTSNEMDSEVMRMSDESSELSSRESFED